MRDFLKGLLDLILFALWCAGLAFTVIGMLDAAIICIFVIWVVILFSKKV